MKRLACAPILALALVAACRGTPDTFVRAREPKLISVPVREGLTYDEVWEKITAILRTHFAIESESKVAGLVRTHPVVLQGGTFVAENDPAPSPGVKSVGASTYQVRAIVRIIDDGRSIEVETYAMYGKPGREKIGYDQELLDALANEMRAAVGREAGGGRPLAQTVAARAVPAPADAAAPRQDPPAPEALKPAPALSVLGPSDVAFRVWYADLGGSGKGDESGFNDTSVGFDSDADMEYDVLLSGDLELGLTRYFSVRFGFTGGRWSGTSITGDMEAIDGIVFPPGSRLSYELDIDTFAIQPMFHVPSVENAGFSIKGGPDFRFLRTRLEVEGSAGEADESWNLFFLGFNADITWRHPSGPFLNTSFHPLFLGIPAVSYGFELTVGGGFRHAPVEVELGYRYFGVDAFRQEKEDFTLSLHGPYLSVSVTF